jgi:hypothetical protein
VLLSYRRTYLPRSYHIVQEIQKFNLSDYRPRQEQYVMYSHTFASAYLRLSFIGSKKLSRRFEQPNVCVASVDLLSVKLKVKRKTKKSLSGLMILAFSVLQVIRCN